MRANNVREVRFGSEFDMPFLWRIGFEPSCRPLNVLILLESAYRLERIARHSLIRMVLRGGWHGLVKMCKNRLLTRWFWLSFPNCRVDGTARVRYRKVEMKITGVSSTLFQSRMPRRMGDANSPMGRAIASGCIIELHTDTELTGISMGGGGAIGIIKSLVDGVLIGQDPRRVTGLWQRMVNKHFKGGHDGIANDAISALDIAMWDLKAKYDDEPLWKTLGGVNQPVNAYASGLDMPLSDQEIFDFYRGMAVDYGFKDGKLKVGLDQDFDLRRIGLMKDALSINTDEPGLMVDANEYWSPKQAIRKVREMEEEYDLMWIEEPARRWDFLGLRRICDAVRTPVCAGENLDTLGDFLGYFHNRSADIIQVGSGMTGITCALQIADAAYGFNLPVTLGGSAGHHHAHLATVIPNYVTIEVGNAEPDSAVASYDVTFENGQAILGDKPGLGIEIHHDEIEKLKVDRIPPGSGPSPFGRRPGAGLYEVPPTEEEKSEAVRGITGQSEGRHAY